MRQAAGHYTRAAQPPACPCSHTAGCIWHAGSAYWGAAAAGTAQQSPSTAAAPAAGGAAAVVLAAPTVVYWPVWRLSGTCCRSGHAWILLQCRDLQHAEARLSYSPRLRGALLATRDNSNQQHILSPYTLR